MEQKWIQVKYHQPAYIRQDVLPDVSDTQIRHTPYDSRWTAEYDYKKHRYIPRKKNPKRKIAFLFSAVLIVWCLAFGFGTSPAVNRILHKESHQNTPVSYYTPVNPNHAMFTIPLSVSGDAMEIFWTVSESGQIATFSDIRTVQGEVCPAKEAGLALGDVIIKINDIPLIQKDLWSKITSSDPVKVTYYRNGAQSEVNVIPAFGIETNSFRLGIEYYIHKGYTETTSTLTFYNAASGKFASTAHQVEFTGTKDESGNEIASGQLQLKEGAVFNAQVTGMNPDGLQAKALDRCGTVKANNVYGVFGYLDSKRFQNVQTLYAAPASEIQTGSAYILSAVKGEEIQQYAIEVTGVDYSNTSAIEFIVTDEYLQSIGGLLHGMSGSPIVQNGKIIGAVARMNIKTGVCYGTLAEIMLSQMEAIVPEDQENAA